MEAVWPLFIHLAPPSGGYNKQRMQHGSSLCLLGKLKGFNVNIDDGARRVALSSVKTMCHGVKNNAPLVYICSD